MRGSRPLMESHNFLRWPSSAPTLPSLPPPSLPHPHLTDEGVELSSSNPLEERKQKPETLDICRGKSFYCFRRLDKVFDTPMSQRSSEPFGLKNLRLPV